MSTESAPERALTGLRVVEFTAGMAGPWIGRFMAWCGAEVIKVESKGHPDVTRLYVPPRGPFTGVQPELSPWFTDWNAGKRFVALDLTKPAAVDLCKRLVAQSDVVVENYSTGVLSKLGLGYGELHEVKPDLILCSSTGYGDSGPYNRYVTWGPNIEALSGLASVSGFGERECTLTQYAYPDPLSAMHGLFAVLCALEHRRRTGEGQYINLAQYEATVAGFGQVAMEQTVLGREPERRGNRLSHAAPQGVYRCKGEDRWCAITIANDREWKSLCAAIGFPQWADDPRFRDHAGRLTHHDEIDECIQRWTAERDAYEVMDTLQQAGIAAGVVQTAADLLEHDSHLRARGFFESIDHLKRGEPVVATGIPLGLTATPGKTTSTGASIGQDNDYVFGELLGIPRERLRKLADEGVVQS